MREVSPIDRTIPGHSTTLFSGDNPDRSHEILWDIPKFLEGQGATDWDRRPPDERAALVIIGGGMSGLGTAWLLRDLKPVLLERADRFGGNARGESWQGIDYGIGAAYFLEADAGSPLEALYHEWDLADITRVKVEEDPVLLNGKIYHDFWSGESDPDNAQRFTQVRQYLLNVWEELEDEFYPEMPTDDAELLARLLPLDQVSLRQHLETVIGGELHPHIVAVIDHYCWSSLGGTWDEISAAAGLNFLTAEFGKVHVTAGGNAAVAARIVERLEPALPAGNLRTSAIVFGVSVTDAGVMIGYHDHQGQVRTVLANAIAMCCPKFVVKRILKDIEPDRLAAIDSLRYRSYLLANVLLTTELQDEFYDLFLADADPTRATDVVMATYARPVAGHTVLTLYRGLPYDGARASILAPGAHDRISAEFEAQIRNEILPALGIAASDLAGIRLTRWGHPLPLAQTGILAAELPARLRAPFKERVFFVEQDNWALPAIETALGEAITFAPRIRARVGAVS
jgi:hypothetical protein